MEPNAEQSRSRHLSIEKYWLAELSESILTIQHLPTAQMIADIFTKGPGAITGGCKAWEALSSMLIA